MHADHGERLGTRGRGYSAVAPPCPTRHRRAPDWEGSVQEGTPRDASECMSPDAMVPSLSCWFLSGFELHVARRGSKARLHEPGLAENSSGKPSSPLPFRGLVPAAQCGQRTLPRLAGVHWGVSGPIHCRHWRVGPSTSPIWDSGPVLRQCGVFLEHQCIFAFDNLSHERRTDPTITAFFSFCCRQRTGILGSTALFCPLFIYHCINTALPCLLHLR